jgi:hypothetical protein
MKKEINKFITPSGKKIKIVRDEEDFLCIRLGYKKSFRKFIRSLIEVYKSILINKSKMRFYPYLENNDRYRRKK